MRLNEFLDCFDEMIQVSIYDKNNVLLVECAVSDVQQRVLNCRCVKKCSCIDSKIVIYTELKTQEELDKHDQKGRVKFRCPLASRKYGCSCENPCSDSKYGRTVHLAMKDNPRLINIPPRDSDQWKRNTMQELLLNALTSVRK